jgi:cytidine deaminase
VSAPEWGPLVAAAAEVRERAYAPYSGYHVGAAILGASGRVFVGCNVENASYGLTVCAERNAVAQMIAAGERDPVALAVVTAGPEAGSPCGACRQVLAEIARDLPVALAIAGEPSPARVTSLAALLPESFRGELVTGASRP